ncbi:MAG: rRNA maturation RNase YbeY [Paraperlucidibaca sp.]
MAINVWLDIDDDVSAEGLPTEADCQRYFDAVLQIVGITQSCSVDIRVVGREEGRILNAQYRDKDYATNVLSFSADLPEALLAELDERPLGDLAICADVVAAEAIEQGKPLAAHWAHMIVHGGLHLLGHDHIEADDAARMEPLELEILSCLGIDNPYDDDDIVNNTHITPVERKTSP